MMGSVSESYLLALIIHRLEYGDRLQAVSLFSQNPASLLLSLLYRYAYADNLAPSLVDDIDERLGGLSVGKEVIDYQDLVPIREIWARDEDIVHALVCEGVCLRDILVVSAVSCLALLGEDDGDIVKVAEERGDGYTAGLYGQYLCHLAATEAAFQLVGYLPDDIDINLVVQETAVVVSGAKATMSQFARLSAVTIP